MSKPPRGPSKPITRPDLLGQRSSVTDHVTIGVRMPISLADEIRRYANDENRSLSSFIRHVLINMLSQKQPSIPPSQT